MLSRAPTAHASYIMYPYLGLVTTCFASIIIASALPDDNFRSSGTAPRKSRQLLNYHTDPCGPPRPRGPPGPSHPVTTAVSTCGEVVAPSIAADGNYSVGRISDATPSSHGVNCINDHTGEILNFTSCERNLENLCIQLQNPQVQRGQWLWSSGGPNCTFGVWLPIDEETSAQIPAYAHCRNDIMEPMARWCGYDTHGRSNVATVNLAKLPTPNFTGEAVDANHPSYIMVAETYDDLYH